MDVGPAGITQLQEMITRIINVSVGIAFIAMTGYLIWGGIKFLTSGGDQKSLSSATQTVTWALLGIIFLVLAWLFLRLIEALTGVPVTKFCLKFEGC